MNGKNNSNKKRMASAPAGMRNLGRSETRRRRLDSPRVLPVCACVRACWSRLLPWADNFFYPLSRTVRQTSVAVRPFEAKRACPYLRGEGNAKISGGGGVQAVTTQLWRDPPLRIGRVCSCRSRLFSRFFNFIPSPHSRRSVWAGVAVAAGVAFVRAPVPLRLN